MRNIRIWKVAFMYYRLTDNFALRSWRFVPRAVIHRKLPRPLQVDEETFDLLKLCDGEHDLPENERIRKLCERKVIAPCDQGENPSEWSMLHQYDHRYLAGIKLMLTGKCNLNCRHCFNAADNADMMQEWSWDELMDLLDQAEECGVHFITLTGGEPMIHPKFTDLVREIYRRNMVIESLLTNGWFLTQDTLDLFKEIGAKPVIRISFDGIGHHEWMRNQKCSEDRTLKAIRLCAENGFITQAQTQVYRENLDTLRDTICLLEETGATKTRLIRTGESMRWNKNEGNCVPVDEYMELMLDLADWYMHGRHSMQIDIWQFLWIDPLEGTYNMLKDKSLTPTTPLCVNNRAIMSITNEGQVVPCMPMGAYVSRFGIPSDNVKERKLKDILDSGAWIDTVCANHYDMAVNNAQCRECEWFDRCGAGCRFAGVICSGEFNNAPDYYGPDAIACLFFRGGWINKVKERLKDFRCVNRT